MLKKFIFQKFNILIVIFLIFCGKFTIVERFFFVWKFLFLVKIFSFYDNFPLFYNFGEKFSLFVNFIFLQRIPIFVKNILQFWIIFPFMRKISDFFERILYLKFCKHFLFQGKFISFWKIFTFLMKYCHMFYWFWRTSQRLMEILKNFYNNLSIFKVTLTEYIYLLFHQFSRDFKAVLQRIWTIFLAFKKIFITFSKNSATFRAIFWPGVNFNNFINFFFAIYEIFTIF